VITYRATLDVSAELALYVSGPLLAERRRRGTPRGSRALTCFRQAVLGLHWFRDRARIDGLGRDNGISRANMMSSGSVQTLSLARPEPAFS
jgi:hypothetical protein